MNVGTDWFDFSTAIRKEAIISVEERVNSFKEAVMCAREAVISFRERVNSFDLAVELLAERTASLTQLTQ